MTRNSADVPQRAMNGWLKSPEHLANIVSGKFTETGVGIAQSADGTHVRHTGFSALKAGAPRWTSLNLPRWLPVTPKRARFRPRSSWEFSTVSRRAPLDDAALATAIAANRRATALIANAMVALGLLDKRADRYSLTEVSRRYLLRSSAEYLGGLILFDEAIFETWAHLDQVIRTGAPARAD